MSQSYGRRSVAVRWTGDYSKLAPLLVAVEGKF